MQLSKSGGRDDEAWGQTGATVHKEMHWRLNSLQWFDTVVPDIGILQLSTRHLKNHSWLGHSGMGVLYCDRCEADIIILHSIAKALAFMRFFC